MHLLRWRSCGLPKAALNWTAQPRCCWVPRAPRDRKYAAGDTVPDVLEKEAREGRKGLRADPQPVPPWEGWREHGSGG
jgi:hypothetical protein